MVGTTVLHYKIAARLGSGGMGEVYRAEDTRLGREVALKFLQASAHADGEQRARFLTEARAASALRSPHIAAIYDIGEESGAAFIVMELVEGQLLSERLAGGPLAVADAVDVAAQVADALDEAHARAIVHRDIKSSNLIITARGVVKVLDFGLAKFLPGAHGAADGVTRANVTSPGIVLGTVSYMSPEQALGREVDGRADIFSLGVVLYEMLAGKLPFQGRTATEVIDRILHHAPPPLGRFSDGVPPGLEVIVRKALEKEPDFRYQTARELQVDLRTFVRDRSGAGTGGSAAGFQAGVGPAGAGQNVSPAVAVMTFSNITGEPADDWIGSGIAETLTADLQKIQGLSVVGRARIFDVLKNLTSAEQGRIEESVAIEVGRKLSAAWILVGGYQRLGELIRITGQLVDVPSGGLVRTVKVDGRINDIFELQDKIVYELTQGLNLTLGGSEIAGIERQETRSMEAYEAYSRGLMNLRMAGRDSLDRAVYLFEKAIGHDPGYAAAWAALGAAYELKASFLGLTEMGEKAIENLRKALSLDPQSMQARSWLGSALNAVGRFEEAIEVLREATRLDPTHVGARMNLARSYWTGRGQIDEGIVELEQVIALNPESGYAFLQLALLYALVGKFDRAEEMAQSAIQLQEQYLSGKEGLQIVGAHTRLGYVNYRRGRYDEAIREYERELMFLLSTDHALRERSLIELNQKLGAAYLRKGDAAGMARHFDLAVKGFERRVANGSDDPFTKYYVAALYALKEDAEKATKYLAESLHPTRALNLTRARLDPDFDPVRADARFRALLENAEEAEKNNTRSHGDTAQTTPTKNN
jgi:tetratricopeptide (TPR) repeat protein